MWWSRDPFFGILGPLISPERIKLETSNLAQRWTTVSTNEKMKKLFQNVSCGGPVTHFLEFCDPLIISGTVTARNFKFGTVMEGSEY